VSNRLLVVSNRSAGSADEETVATAVRVLREAGADVALATTAQPDDLRSVLGAADGRTPVLVGGDGSLHLAVATLRDLGRLRADQPLGVIPLGTGNDLARTVGIPLDPAEAARALLTGTPRTLDLVVDDAGGVVVNAVHLGIGAEAAEQAGAWKERLGAAAYAVGSAVAGVRATGWRVRVVADETVLHEGEPVLMVGIANGRTIGGGAELAPEASPSDGWLDVVVATSTGPLARLGFGVAMRDGEHVEREDVQAVRARSVTVSGEAFPLNADGELDGPVEARTWTVEPGAWSLLAP
jgi:YegS/Rv2252/BmrU family lipid kinase